MRFLSTATLTISTLLFSACATETKRLQAISSEVLTSGSGVVFLSASGDQPCKVAATNVLVEPRGASQNVFAAPGGVTANNGFMKSAFEDRLGFFTAVVLKPGDYQLSLVSLGPYHYKSPAVAEFSIGPGEAKYVGEVAVRGCGSLFVSLKDRWSSVRPLATATLPQFPVDRVVVEIPPLKPIESR